MFRLCNTCKKEFNEYLEGAACSNPLGLSYTSVPMNALRTILTNRLKYKMKKKKISDLTDSYFIHKPPNIY